MQDKITSLWILFLIALGGLVGLVCTLIFEMSYNVTALSHGHPVLSMGKGTFGVGGVLAFIALTSGSAGVKKLFTLMTLFAWTFGGFYLLVLTAGLTERSGKTSYAYAETIVIGLVSAAFAFLTAYSLWLQRRSHK